MSQNCLFIIAWIISDVKIVKGFLRTIFYASYIAFYYTVWNYSYRWCRLYFRQINLLAISTDSTLFWNVHLLPLQQIWKSLSWHGDLLSYQPVRWAFSALSNVNKLPGRSFPEDNFWHLYMSERVGWESVVWILKWLICLLIRKFHLFGSGTMPYLTDC